MANSLEIMAANQKRYHDAWQGVTDKYNADQLARNTAQGNDQYGVPLRPEYSPSYDSNKFLSMGENTINRQRQNYLNMAGVGAAGQTAQAEGELAMRGGLSSGARERVAMGGAKNYMNMAQNVNQQSGDARQALLGEDLSQKVQEGNQKNAFAMNKYKEKMAAYGAEKTANATANSGK